MKSTLSQNIFIRIMIIFILYGISLFFPILDVTAVEENDRATRQELESSEETSTDTENTAEEDSNPNAESEVTQPPNQSGSSGGSNESKVTYDSFTNFPGIGRISNLCQLTQALWFLGFAILFVSVIGSILYGGFLYTAAGVNAAQVNQAKEVISNAFVGLILGLSIFIILQTIDPNLLNGNCSIESIEPFSYSTPTQSGAVQNIPSDLSCTESDPSVWKFQGGKSMAGVDERLHAVATEIFRQCSQFGEFQISSTVRNRGGTSFHETGDALDFADGSQIIRDKQTGQCIERVAAACGIPQSRINPGVDANQRYHVHIDLGTRD